MKNLLLITSGMLFLSIVDLPIGYYTFLRFLVTIGAVIIVISEVQNGINFWVFAFGAIAIMFNPLMPVYLGDKSAWIPIDIIAAILFSIKALTLKKP